jgi:cation diffusion facilitator family transporter
MLSTAERIGSYSIAVNLGLVGIKAALASLCGSIALLADAIHSSTDVISSATVLAGIRLSRRKSRRFPYGLYKVENFVSLVSAGFIFLAGYEISRIAFFEPHNLKKAYVPYAMIGVLLTIAITFLFSRYELKRGKEIGSPSLVADATHIRTDMLSSAVIMAGLLGGLFGFSLDKGAALIVVVMVLRAGAKIFLDALRVLLDASIDFETMDRVKSLIIGDPQVHAINALWGRNSGPFKFIEADIVITSKDLEKAHAVSQRIEKGIRKTIRNVDHVLIHYEPMRKETSTCAVPLDSEKSAPHDHFGDAPYFYIATRRESDGSLVSEGYHQNPFVGTEKGKGIKVSEWLLQKGVDTVFAPKGLEGKGPGYVFSDAGVDIIVVKDKNLQQVIQAFSESRL